MFSPLFSPPSFSFSSFEKKSKTTPQKQNTQQCFGQNSRGQLGQGDAIVRGLLPNELGDALLAVDFGAGLTATEIVTGCQHACAILDDGSVKCFGYNNYGQLGQVRFFVASEASLCAWAIEILNLICAIL